MSKAPKIYGWCPGALRPMMSGDGLVVRIRAPLGRLCPEQARGVADLSERFGNGLLDISARANLQLRGVSPASHAALITGLRGLGLVDKDAEAEARRNILLTPFWARDDTSHTLAQQLNAALTESSDLTLPGKFGFAIDCGPHPVLQDIAADIRIERSTDGLILRADGATMGHTVRPETAVQSALDLARWFLDTGGVADGRGRMRPHLMRGAALPLGHTTAGLRSPFSADPGPTPQGALVALEFGQIPAQSFAALAEHGALRLTPWRMLLVEGADALPALPGLILDPADARLRVTACTGSPGCPQALGPTRALARDLAVHVPPDAHLHVSGCTKGCAHPSSAPLTLVATGADRFALIRDGTPTATAAHSHLSAAQLRDTPDILKKGR